MIYIFETEQEALAVEENKHILHDGAKWVVYTGDDIPGRKIPDVLTATQFELHVSAIGKHDEVLTYINALPPSNELRIRFNRSNEFHRNNELLKSMFIYFAVDIDEFFINAAQIQ